MREEVEIVDELHGLDGFVISPLTLYTISLLMLSSAVSSKAFPPRPIGSVQNDGMTITLITLTPTNLKKT
jgi:hypothetical protein